MTINEGESSHEDEEDDGNAEGLLGGGMSTQVRVLLNPTKFNGIIFAEDPVGKLKDCKMILAQSFKGILTLDRLKQIVAKAYKKAEFEHLNYEQNALYRVTFTTLPSANGKNPLHKHVCKLIPFGFVLDCGGMLSIIIVPHDIQESKVDSRGGNHTDQAGVLDQARRSLGSLWAVEIMKGKGADTPCLQGLTFEGSMQQKKEACMAIALQGSKAIDVGSVTNYEKAKQDLCNAVGDLLAYGQLAFPAGVHAVGVIGASSTNNRVSPHGTGGDAFFGSGIAAAPSSAALAVTTTEPHTADDANRATFNARIAAASNDNAHGSRVSLGTIEANVPNGVEIRVTTVGKSFDVGDWVKVVRVYNADKPRTLPAAKYADTFVIHGIGADRTEQTLMFKRFEAVDPEVEDEEEDPPVEDDD